MHPTSFRYEVSEGIGRITLARPATLNSLTFDVYGELRDLFLALRSERSVRAVVLSGEGKGFCSGGDVREIIGPLLQRDAAGLLAFTRLTCDLVKAIRRAPQPVIAALNGVAAGGGAAIALACDLRLASSEARIAFLFTRVGLSGADMGAAFLLPRVVGLGRAAELLMLGDSVDAAMAERYGLVNRVVRPERLLPEALALAARLAEGPAMALRLTKERLNAELSSELDAALEGEAEAQAICMQAGDMAEAYRAFLERRPPRFRREE